MFFSLQGMANSVQLLIADSSFICTFSPKRGFSLPQNSSSSSMISSNLDDCNSLGVKKVTSIIACQQAYAFSVNPTKQFERYFDK